MNFERQIVNQDANLELIRGAFDEHELGELQREIDFLWENWPATSYPSPNVRHIFTDMLPLDYLGSGFAPVVQGIIEALEIPDNSRFGLNGYLSSTAGTFHTDPEPWKTAVLIYPTGNHFLDIAPRAENAFVAEKDFTSLRIEAGDIVIADSEVFHRGRNIGAETLKDLVVFCDQPI